MVDLGWIEFKREDNELSNTKFRRMYFRKRGNDMLIYASSEKFERVAGMIRISNVSVSNDKLRFRVVTVDGKVLIFKAKHSVDQLSWLSVLKQRKDSKMNENQEVQRPTLAMLAEMAKDQTFKPPIAPPSSSSSSSPHSSISEKHIATTSSPLLPPPLPSSSMFSQPKPSLDEEGGPECD